MQRPESLARRTAVTFLAVVWGEISFLPFTRKGQKTWSSWLSAALVHAASELTTKIGIGVSYFFGLRLHNPRPTDIHVPRSSREIEPEILATQRRVEAGANRSRSSRNTRKLALLKRAGLFTTDTQGARIHRACTLEDLRKAYRLVHDVYLGTSYINSEPSGLRLRIFETTSAMATFVAKIDGRVVGVVSVIGDSPELGLPSDAAFKPELDRLRATGARLCEATNQAVAEEFRNSGVPTELIRCAVAQFMQGGFDEAIATVSPNHTAFNEMLGFREIGAARSYSAKIHDPVVALSMDVNQYRTPALHFDNEVKRFMREFLADENPFLVYVEAWAKQAERHFLSADLLQQLFVTERNFIAECSNGELRVLHRRWGRELFAAVTGGLFLPPAEPSEEEPETQVDKRPSADDRLDLFNLPSNQTSARNPEPFRSRRFRRVRKLLQRARPHSARSHC